MDICMRFPTEFYCCHFVPACILTCSGGEIVGCITFTVAIFSSVSCCNTFPPRNHPNPNIFTLLQAHLEHNFVNFNNPQVLF